LGDAVSLHRLAGIAVAPEIEGQNPITLCEIGELIGPDAAIAAPSMDEEDGVPLPSILIKDLQVILQLHKEGKSGEGDENSQQDADCQGVLQGGTASSHVDLHGLEKKLDPQKFMVNPRASGVLCRGLRKARPATHG
jgi:hypothetical protein